MDERGRRLYAAAEVRAIGYGGLAAVARATGMSRGTIGRGLKDLDHAPLPSGRVRRDGGGRPPLSASDPTLLEDLRQLIEPVTLGDPVRPLRWVSKSHKKLAAALRAQGHTVSPNTVRKLLPQLGYSRQANRKANAYFHRFRPVVFIETGHRCSRKPASCFHDFDHLFSSWTAPVKGELGV